MITLSHIFVIAGLVLAAIELAIGFQTGFDLLLVGTILLSGGGLGLYTGNSTYTLLASATLGIAYIVFGRTFIKRKLYSFTHQTNTDRLIGRAGVVIRSITPDTAGLVRLDDEDWRASSEEVLYEKDKIKVISVEGVTLKVSKGVK